MTSSQPKFTQKQRTRLRTLGLCPAQIDEIEGVLKLNRSLLEQPAPMSDVREELGALRDVIDCARKVASKITDPEEHAKDKFAARNEARWRLHMAASEVSDVIEALSASVAGLEKLGQITERALDNLPKKQRRSVAADFRPVARIDEALLRGFMKAYKPPFPPYMPRVSSSDNSTFRQIVGICYEAAGLENSDPVRAIKNYKKVLKQRAARRSPGK